MDRLGRNMFDLLQTIKSEAMIRSGMVSPQTGRWATWPQFLHVRFSSLE